MPLLLSRKKEKENKLKKYENVYEKQEKIGK